MSLSFTMRISVPADVLINMIDGESVLLNLTSERYFGLDQVGSCMWMALTQSQSIAEAYGTLLEQYDVDAGRLQADLRVFIETLMEHRLVEVHGG